MNITAIKEKLDRLLLLYHDWDGYGSVRIKPESAQQALRVLTHLNALNHDLPTPSLAPMSSGDVEIYWNRDELWVEIECASGQAPSYCVVDSSTGKDFEGDLADDYDRLKPYIERLKQNTP